MSDFNMVNPKYQKLFFVHARLLNKSPEQFKEEFKAHFGLESFKDANENQILYYIKKSLFEREDQQLREVII